MLLHGGENYPVVPLSPGADDNTNSVSSSCCPLYPHLSRPPEILVHRTRKLTSRTLYIRRDVLCVRDGVPLGAQIDAVSGRQPRESTQPGCIVVVVSNNRTAFTTTVSLPSCQFYCFLSNEPWLPNRSGFSSSRVALLNRICNIPRRTGTHSLCPPHKAGAGACDDGRAGWQNLSASAEASRIHCSCPHSDDAVYRLDLAATREREGRDGARAHEKVTPPHARRDRRHPTPPPRWTVSRAKGPTIAATLYVGQKTWQESARTV